MVQEELTKAPSLINLSAVQLPDEDKEPSTLEQDGQKKKKIFKMFSCSCHILKCSTNLTVERRESTFKHFQDLEWKKQAEYIASTISIETPSRRRSLAINESGKEEFKKNSIRKYTVDSIQVCKQVYLSCLGVSSKRVDNVLKMANDGNGFVNKIGKVKTPKANDDQIQEVKSFLMSKSKYKNPNSKSIDHIFFFPGLTQDMIYEEYLNNVIKNPLSKTYFRNILNSMNFHTFIDRKSDLCYDCQNFQSLFSKSGCRKVQEDWDKHLNRAENPLKYLTRIEKGQEENMCDTLYLGFDLDGSLSVPFLRDMKDQDRLLQIFTLNIRNLASKSSFSFLWSEEQHCKLDYGKEICSCLEEFLSPMQLHGKKNICTFSPNFCLKNFKKTFILFVIYMVKINALNSWTHFFTELGHSSQLTSAEFEKINKIKKTNNKIYTKQEWAEKIKEIERMDCKVMAENFRPYEELDCSIQFKPHDENKEPFVFENLRCIRVDCSESFLDFKVENDLTVPWSTVSYNARRGSSLDKLTRLPVKSNFNPISSVKFSNIQSLFPMLPPDVQAFFNSLKTRKEDKVPGNLPIRYSLLSV